MKVSILVILLDLRKYLWNVQVSVKAVQGKLMADDPSPVHPHVEELVSDPGGLDLHCTVEQPQGGQHPQHPHPPPHYQEHLTIKQLNN